MNRKIPFGHDLPQDAVERFNAFAERKGLVKWQAVVAALELFQAAPAELRDRLMEGDWEGAAGWLERPEVGFNTVALARVAREVSAAAADEGAAAQSARKAQRRKRRETQAGA